jgi:hypothetical protein
MVVLRALRALGAEPLVQAAVVAPGDGRAAHLQRAGATRWLRKRPFTTTSQPAKKSGPLMAGMPRNDVSNTTLLPAPS